MADDIENLRILVDSVAGKVAKQVKADNLKGLKEMLWNVPVNILAEFLSRE